MHPYRRIISYLYKYDQGQKGDNTGYIRVETRQEGVRLHLHIKDLRMMDEKRLQIYFYIHKKERMKLIYVDELLCVRGICEYKSQVEPDFSGAQFDDIDGVVFLEGGHLIYGSCWDEREIEEEKLWFGKSEEENAASLETEVPGTENAASLETKVPGTENAVSLETKVPETENLNAYEAKENAREENGAVEGSDLHTSEIPEPTDASEFFSSFPEITLAGSYHLIRAVRIQLDDLSLLQHTDWKLADNAFLKQAYEAEEHLMVGRIQMPNQKNVWVLGVPGCYDNREKYLAGIFGFSDYIPQKESEYKTGGKGYWIRPIAPVEKN